MGIIEVSFHPEAMEEYIASYAWYFKRGRHLAQSFEHEIERALRLIASAPGRWPAYIGNTRRILVRRFPYSLIYSYTEKGVVVLAVAHGHRKPGFWKKRGK